MDARPHDPAEPPEDPPDGRAAEPGDGTAGEPDVERRWAEIVARLGELTTPDGGAADETPPPPDDPGPGATAPVAAPDTRAPSGRGTASDPRSWGPDPAVEEAEEHFEPPDPGPVLTGDPLLTMAWAAVVGVPALLLVTALVWRDVPTIVLQVAGLAFVLGLGLLVWRMPRGDEHDDGPGAVV